MTLSQADKLEIGKQFANNLYNVSGRDVRNDIEGVLGLLRFEDDKLVKILVNGFKVHYLAEDLFERIDVSNVKYLRFGSTDTKYVKKSTFDRFDNLDQVLFLPSALVETDMDYDMIDSIGFRGLYLQSDEDLLIEIKKKFVENYEKEFDIKVDESWKRTRGEPSQGGFQVKHGVLYGLQFSITMPVLSTRLFEGIDVSKVGEIKFDFCQIERIEDGTFDIFPSLNDLCLMENKLEKLPKISDDILKQLRAINVQNNDPQITSHKILKDVSDNYMDVFFKGEREARFRYKNTKVIYYSSDHDRFYSLGN